MTPDAEVLLSWNIVAKRIEKLMKEDRYLLAEDKVKYAQYKQKQEEKALQQAKEELGTVADETEIVSEEMETLSEEDISPLEESVPVSENDILQETESQSPIQNQLDISAENYVISDMELGVGTAKRKVSAKCGSHSYIGND